jgi:hypothetical protein
MEVKILSRTLTGHGGPKTQKRPGIQKGIRADYRDMECGILCCSEDYATECRESKNCAESFTISANLLLDFSVPEQRVPAGRPALIVAPFGAF